MPRKSRRQTQAQAAVLRRHESQDEELSDDEAYGGVIYMDIEQDDDADLTKTMKFNNKFDLLIIGDIFELCKRERGLQVIPPDLARFIRRPRPNLLKLSEFVENFSLDHFGNKLF